MKLEINRPNTGKRRYQRPYVAVWVEDKDGHPVRTLTLWVTATKHGSQWIPDLKRWYRGDQARRRVDDDRPGRHHRAADPRARQVRHHLGRQGRPGQAGRPRRIHPVHRGRARARDLSDHPPGDPARRPALRQGTQGEHRDQVGVGRMPAEDEPAGRTVIGRSKELARVPTALVRGIPAPAMAAATERPMIGSPSEALGRIEVERPLLPRSSSSRASPARPSSRRPQPRAFTSARGTATGPTSAPGSTRI